MGYNPRNSAFKKVRGVQPSTPWRGLNPVQSLPIGAGMDETLKALNAAKPIGGSPSFTSEDAVVVKRASRDSFKAPRELSEVKNPSLQDKKTDGFPRHVNGIAWDEGAGALVVSFSDGSTQSIPFFDCPSEE